MITGLSVVTSVPHQCKILVFKKISRNKLFDINYSNIFFDSFPSIIKVKRKINKRGLIKLKSFFSLIYTQIVNDYLISAWEMATHSSILAWEIPWTEEPGGYSP